MEAEIVGHEVIEPCLRCGASSRGVVTQAIDGDRLTWGITSRCEGCADEGEDDGGAWGRMPDDLRQALIAGVGLARLRADPEVTRPLRLQVLRMFRRYGASISEASDTYDRLTDAGVTGTPAEMRLLARQLETVGTRTRLDLPAEDGTAAPSGSGPRRLP
ncbi:hypothetical protein [Polymorphospora sp. NPDC050346]|uniref:hypothetical protein n=1 Tax=Polymorphospora sp. NPDC050346 TaxID=3155780 RepID=UPI0033DACB62